MNNNIGGMMNPGMGVGDMSGINCMNNSNTMGQNMSGMNPSIIDPTAGMSLYTPQGSGTLISDIVKQNDKSVTGPDNSSYNHPMQTPLGVGARVMVDPSTGYPSAGYPSAGYPSTGYSSTGYRSTSGGNNNQTSQYIPRDRRSGGNDYESHYNYKKYGTPKQQDMRLTDTQRDENNDNVSEYSNMRELANDVNNSLEALEQIENNTKNKKRKNKKAKSDIENQENQDVLNDESKITLDTLETENDYLKLFIEFLLLLTLYVIMSQQFVVGFASNYITQLNPDEEGAISMMGIIIYGLIMTIMFFVIRKIMFSKM